MRKAILTQGDPEAGILKMGRLADQVVPVRGADLVNAPPLSDASVRCFFSPGSVIGAPSWQAWLTVNSGERDPTDRHLGFLEVCDSFDEIELWFDSDPAAQIKLAKLLWFVRDSRCDIGKFIVVRPEFPIAQTSAAEIALLAPSRHRLDPREVDSACLLWTAFGQPTPVPMADLLTTTLEPLPLLRLTILRLLMEVPDPVDGLGAAQRALLAWADKPGASWGSIAEGYNAGLIRPTIAWAEAELLLEDMASCPAPLVEGFEPDPFRKAGRFDTQLFNSHRRKPICLTSLGRDIIRRKVDFSAVNPIARWWGGTHLTNDRLWRWDRQRCLLIGPD